MLYDDEVLLIPWCCTFAQWVHFMEEHPNSDLAQKPEVLSYIGQMAAWTASYVSMALDDVNE